MSDLGDINAGVRDAWRAIGDRFRDAWRAIVEAERARGIAKAEGGDENAAQERYEAALTLFRLAQIEWATATLAAIPLTQEELQELRELVSKLAGRVEALEARAVGEERVAQRLEARADIVDRVVFYDPTHPYEG